jgi:formate dehydrogenase major subunit
MANMGIEPGDMVKVSTRRGVLELRARADDAIPNGLVFIPFCYAEAPANVLTNQALDPYGKIPEFKFCAVRVDAL